MKEGTRLTLIISESRTWAVPRTQFLNSVLEPPALSGHESESEVEVAQSCPALCDPMDYTVHGILQARILEGIAVPFTRGSSQPRDQIQVSCIARDCLPAEPQGKPKNTRVYSLSLLRWIFLIHESNQGLLHCRLILYQLSHKGNPRILEWVAYPFSSTSSQPRNWTAVSYIAGRFFTN